MNATNPSDNSSPVVFVVDDDEDLRQTVRQVLEPEGYRVAVAPSGAEALHQLRQGFRPALILVDLRMPGLDGASVCHALRSSTELAAIPTVVMTAAGAAAPTDLPCPILRKPFDLDELLLLVASHVPRHEAPSGTRRTPV